MSEVKNTNQNNFSVSIDEEHSLFVEVLDGKFIEASIAMDDGSQPDFTFPDLYGLKMAVDRMAVEMQKRGIPYGQE